MISPFKLNSSLPNTHTILLPSFKMQFSAAALVLGLTALKAAAHSVFTTLFVDGVNQGDGTCVRMNMNPDTATSPINDLSSNDMACGMYFSL